MLSQLVRLPAILVLIGLVILLQRDVAAAPVDDSGQFLPPDRTGTFANLIDSTGGTISSADGVVSVTVPAGAVPDYSLVQLATETTAHGIAVDLSVVGLRDKSITSFELPVSLEAERPKQPDESSGELLVTKELDPQPVEADQNYVSDTVTLTDVNVGRFRIEYGIDEPALETFSANITTEGGSLSTASQSVTIVVPAGASEDDLRVDYREVPPTGNADLTTLKQLDLNATSQASGLEVSTFDEPLEVTISHSAEQLAGLNPDDVKLYWLDEQDDEWSVVPDQETDGAGTVTARLSHFSIYATATSTFISGPGNLLWHQGGEHAGAASYAIPIETPSGPGGFSIPPVILDYNSSRVDEMKSANSVGSWAGVGWDVSIPSIRRDPSTNYYYL